MRDEEDDVFSVAFADHKRLVAERFRRIWQLVEDIAGQPGKSRKELAGQFALSERQVQADLNVIRREMGLPLVRRQGYRFLIDTEDNGPQFSLAEAQLLLMLLRRAAHDPTLPVDRLRSLMMKLPFLFPLHLRPLVAKTLEAANQSERGGRQQEIFATLAEALLRRSYVKLHYPAGDPISSIQEPIVQPEVLFPYCKSWHLIGTCRQRGRMMVFDLDNVVAVTAAAGV
ncbi:MAG TPA: WYL domain-containing protein [Chloroflexota bacterium]|nr:WYL domain-containing protein [Chloroflexota bacterium]